jgi:hypothetical protein
MKKTKLLLFVFTIDVPTEVQPSHACRDLDHLGVTSPMYLESKHMKRKENSITSIVCTKSLSTAASLNPGGSLPVNGNPHQLIEVGMHV